MDKEKTKVFKKIEGIGFNEQNKWPDIVNWSRYITRRNREISEVGMWMNKRFIPFNKNRFHEKNRSSIFGQLRDPNCLEVYELEKKRNIRKGAMTNEPSSDHRIPDSDIEP